ncbi:hypothetical protein PICMEDRAFT_74207 [Pichia membranifaciens NRRL Y-2026]|uniref:Uncharacterized protein n=1 Tax=Pichia membranifaciens NRRL Y-2026 TaxID=763406 RepID=A0A1E3NIN5_9ASCO|nr:hypothetical protein PICMEDRAFT_74207 [Pichia membranifaciens NRRL Y-2026]ODQ45448.1 hypothetical protein PICMEDRAFT_74207 [Pichia membranifaciens NRRL Y-2026]
MPSTTEVIIPCGDFSLETAMALALLSFVLREHTIVPLDETSTQFSQMLHTYKHTQNTILIGLGGDYVPQQGVFHWTPEIKSNHPQNSNSNSNGRKKKGNGHRLKNQNSAPQNFYFNNTKRGKVVPLATVGLVYRFYGKEVLKKITNFSDSSKINWLYERAYYDFIEIIDAQTRNLRLSNKHESTRPAVPRFNADQHTLPNMVKFYNLQLHDYELLNYDETEIYALRMKRLETVIDILKSAFENYVKYFAFSFMRGESILQQAYNASLSGETYGTYHDEIVVEDPSLITKKLVQDALKRIMIIPEFIPWKEHLFAYERSLDRMGNSLYAIYPDSTQNWRLAAVPTLPASFESRKRLPQEWCGLADGELRDVAGVDDATFVHAQGFIAGASSLLGCIKLAVKAVLNNQKENI